jgi:hypothetical protein
MQQCVNSIQVDLMKKNKDYPSIEDDILLLQQKGKNSSISIEEILQGLSGRWQPMILLFLSLPFCQPIQIPGLSTPFGIAIAFVGLKMIFGRYVWLPKSLLTKTITPETMQKITEKILWLLKKLQS